jgi:hypothetical protein
MKKRIVDWLRRNDAVHRVFGPPSERVGASPTEGKKILVLGNCQARSVASCFEALSSEVTAKGVEIHQSGLEELFSKRDFALHAALLRFDHILLQPPYAPLLADHFPDLAARVRLFPALSFSAYHPDLVYIHVQSTKAFLFGPLGHYNSALAFWGFSNGLSVAGTTDLFKGWAYERLGYFEYWESSRQALLTQGDSANFPLASYLDKWSRAGSFMHSVNHPKLLVFADIAQEILTRLGIPTIPAAVQYIVDEQAEGPVWPIYPEVGERLGVEGHYCFKIERGLCPPGRPVVMLNLRDFVAGSFEVFAKFAPGDLVCDRMAFEAFRAFGGSLAQRQSERANTIVREMPSAPDPGVRHHPYQNLPGHQFWKSAVSSVSREDVDPVVTGEFKFSKESKVATAGSCFAQNISKTLRQRGFNYYVTETDATLPPEEARRRNYGIYSARFGNVYTAKQLVQLVERTYGGLIPEDSAWLRGDGRYVDSFRPQIEPDGFDSPEAVAASRALHLGAVRAMFESMDLFIFTLGLTEAWRSKADGAVFPLAPGVAGGQMDGSRYEFVNFPAKEVVEDLDRFLAMLHNINPMARIILTVSPVPLIATYEPQHVLVASTYSKSVLRVASNEICARHSNCTYFPSYEIITGNYSRGAYFESDLRAITSGGIDHVMRLFLRHYSGESDLAAVNPALLDELSRINDIVCDEEAIGSR